MAEERLQHMAPTRGARGGTMGMRELKGDILRRSQWRFMGTKARHEEVQYGEANRPLTTGRAPRVHMQRGRGRASAGKLEWFDTP
jgi:hypothetical protein